MRPIPDATFTLRLSYGQVKGYIENGKPISPFTEVRGLYVRGDEHQQKPPYKIADSWMKARAAINPTTPFDFVSTNDIVGGNSGSPVINVKGELVGLIFDGNIQSLPGYFVYDAGGEPRGLGRRARHARSAEGGLQGELDRRRARGLGGDRRGGPVAAAAVHLRFDCTTFIAVVIIDATSLRFDGRMMVSALLITLPNSSMYCSATFS